MSSQLALSLSGGPITALMLKRGRLLGRGVGLVSLLHIMVQKVGYFLRVDNYIYCVKSVEHNAR